MSWAHAMRYAYTLSRLTGYRYVVRGQRMGRRWYYLAVPITRPDGDSR